MRPLAAPNLESTSFLWNERSESCNDLWSRVCEGLRRNSADPVLRFFSIWQWIRWLWPIQALIPHQQCVNGWKWRNNNAAEGGENQLGGAPSLTRWPYLSAFPRWLEKSPRTPRTSESAHTHWGKWHFPTAACVSAQRQFEWSFWVKNGRSDFKLSFFCLWLFWYFARLERLSKQKQL